MSWWTRTARASSRIRLPDIDPFADSVCLVRYGDQLPGGDRRLVPVTDPIPGRFVAAQVMDLDGSVWVTPILTETLVWDPAPDADGVAFFLGELAVEYQEAMTYGGGSVRLIAQPYDPQWRGNGTGHLTEAFRWAHGLQPPVSGLR